MLDNDDRGDESVANAYKPGRTGGSGARIHFRIHVFFNCVVMHMLPSASSPFSVI